MRMRGLIAALLLVPAAPSLAGAELVQWADGATIHEYLLVRGAGISWDEARAAALALGPGWDLATITSAEEQAFIDLHQVDLDEFWYGEYWLGGYQSPADTPLAHDGWTWVTGEPWDFSNWGCWGACEPNDRQGPGSEQFLAGNMEESFVWNDEGQINSIYGFVAERTFVMPGGADDPIMIGIDIKEGSAMNRVNPGSRGVLPVTLLSQPGLDPVADVDVASLTFGRTGDEKSLASCKAEAYDANGDGVTDLLCHFSTTRAGLDASNVVVTLKGWTKLGSALRGSDFVSAVPR